MVDFATQSKNIERLLKKRAFVGHYMERRLVNEQRGYRDVVWLSPEENELATDLSFASEICQSRSVETFTSYSTKPVPSLWVSLHDVPFGCHWFMITSVLFHNDELTYTLKSIRSFPGVKYNENKQPPTNMQDISFEQTLETLRTNFKYLIQNINAESIILVIKFLIILMTTLVTGLFKLVFFVGDFSIKLMKELSIFIEASTPMFLGCLEFVSKIIGGFYILLAMLWRGTVHGNSTGPVPSQNFVPSISYKEHKRRSTQNKPPYAWD